MGQLSHHDITAILLALGTLLLSARVMGELAIRFRQPSIVGEILAGIVLGPTVLGNAALWERQMTELFPREGPVFLVLQGITTVAVVLLLRAGRRRGEFVGPAG